MNLIVVGTNHRHSPIALREGIIIGAITKSFDPYDVLASKYGLKLDELSYGAKTGLSSLRRKKALKKHRDDFRIVDVRGNIEERLDKLNDSGLDGAVIAVVGLIRLGLEIEYLKFEILKPHPLQDALAIVVRGGDLQSLDLFSVINSREAIPV